MTQICRCCVTCSQLFLQIGVNARNSFSSYSGKCGIYRWLSRLHTVHFIVLMCNTFWVLCCLVSLVGFGGTNCEVNIDDCVHASCPDNKVCVDGVNSFDCRCRQGFTGDDCTTSIDFCEDNPCQNNATCTNTYGNYTCNCPAGITGESFVRAVLSVTESCMKGTWKTTKSWPCVMTLSRMYPVYILTYSVSSIWMLSSYSVCISCHLFSLNCTFECASVVKIWMINSDV